LNVFERALSLNAGHQLIRTRQLGVTSGHAAAPPRSVVNSRRLKSSIGLPPPCRVIPLTQSVCRMLSLPQGGWKVLWLNLNRSEFGGLPLLRCQPNHSTAGSPRDFDPADDRCGSFTTDAVEATRACLSAAPQKRTNGPTFWDVSKPSDYWITFQF
jgi:hypothetical protein